MGSYREHRVAPALRDVVDAVWVVEQPPGGDASRHPVMPDGCVDLVARPGRPIEVAGPATSAFTVDLEAPSAHFGVRFRPGTAAAVLGVPADSLRDEHPALDQLWSARRVRRLDAARDLDDDDASVDVALDRFQAELIGLLADRPPLDPVVDEAVTRLQAGDGRVAGLGRAIGISDRQLRRHFDRAVGYGPKLLARVLRFQRAWALALEGVGWATVAATTGYADQSHLVNDFDDLAGASPTELLGRRAEDVRFVQAVAPGALVSSKP
jgi:AraC-like DNA-binding protein